MASISEDGDFTDFTLESEDGVKVPVHRNLMAAQPSVLKRMFLSPFEKRKTSSLQLQYKADIVRKFVKFFYKREIEKEEKEEGNLECFMDLVNQYNIPHLKTEVEELAMRKLSVEKMVKIFLLADLHSAEDLRN